MMKIKTLLVILCAGFLLSANLTYAKQNNTITGTLLVVSKTDNSVSFIDIATAEVLKTLPTGQGPHELVISPDGLWAVVSDFVGGNSLTVVDIAKQEVARTVDLDAYPRPHGVQFLANPAYVATTSGATNSLVIVDIHTGAVVSAINTTQQGTHMVAVDLKKNLAFTSNMRSNALAQLNLTTNTFEKAYATAQTPEAIRLSPSGDELWYGANKQGLVKVINLENGENIAQFSGFSFPYRVLFTTDGRLAMVPDFRKDYVRFFDAHAKQELGTLTLKENAGPQGVILHPDNNVLFLSLNTASEVLAIDIHKREVITRFSGVANPDGIGYTPVTFTLGE